MRKWNVQTAAARATRVHARPPLARRGRATAGSNLLDNTCHICGKTFSNDKIAKHQASCTDYVDQDPVAEMMARAVEDGTSAADAVAGS